MIRRKSKGVSTKEPDFVPSVSQAALLLDVQERAIYRWIARGAPGRTEKGYDIAALRAWRGANLEPPRRASRPPTGDAARLLRARANEREAIAKLRELEYELQSGKYTLTTRVEAHNLELIAMTTRALDEWARSLPPSLAGLDERGMYARLVEEARALRTRLARMCSLDPAVTTPAADRRVLEASTALDFATAFYTEAFGEPPPAVSCRGEALTSGREIVEAALSKIRSMKGGLNGQG
jgi:hypothetical protein